MPGDPMPDLVVVGDSHTACLHEAALAQGMQSRMLYINGNFWHENRMRPHPVLGLSAGYRAKLNRQVSAFAAAQGGSVFPQGVPCLASFGYHLGRLTPPFARQGHTPDADHAAADDSRLFVSGAMLDAYIHHHRHALFRVLRLVSRSADLVVIAPPIIHSDPATNAIAARITQLLEAHRIRVFDPRREPGLDGPLAPHWTAADGVHGNAAYGAEVLRRLQIKGMLRAA